jgi:(p)ppGpp synthase/HD superfamily hydrolase
VTDRNTRNTDPELYSMRVESAVRLAARGHYHQFRKRADDASTAEPGQPLPVDHIPYVTHLMGTMAILARLDVGDVVLAAAALHDYLEDVPDPDGRRRIREVAGDDVLELVIAVTENKRPELDSTATWRTRKDEQIGCIATMPADAVLIKGADMLHNLLSLEMDLADTGDREAVWARFNAPEELQLWYFSSVLDAIRGRLGDHRLVLELAAAIRRLTP